MKAPRVEMRPSQIRTFCFRKDFGWEATLKHGEQSDNNEAICSSKEQFVVVSNDEIDLMARMGGLTVMAPNRY